MVRIQQQNRNAHTMRAGAKLRTPTVSPETRQRSSRKARRLSGGGIALTRRTNIEILVRRRTLSSGSRDSIVAAMVFTPVSSASKRPHYATFFPTGVARPSRYRQNRYLYDKRMRLLRNLNQVLGSNMFRGRNLPRRS
jgi:hypothetical protein